MGIYHDSVKPGQMTWMSSDEDGGPDCGYIFGMPNGDDLVIGETPDQCYEEMGGIPGENTHWSIVLYTKKGPFLIGHTSAAFTEGDAPEMLAAAIQAALRLPAMGGE